MAGIGKQGMLARALFSAGLAVLGASQATAADNGLDLISADTMSLSGDLRLIGVGGERSWVEDGFGKLRYGGKFDHEDGPFRVLPGFGEVDLAWQPRFGWALSAT